MNTETEIQSEVEALKARFSETKSLYREVCALLFFRYGIAPTASKLYQYVRKGSMSAPADALTRFWDELRSKARVEIDHPGLPAELRETAASAIAGIWQQATGVARQELAALRLDVQAQLQAAQSELAAARQMAGDLVEQLDASRGQITAASAAASHVRDELEAERRVHAVAVARLQELQRHFDEALAVQERQRADFSTDLAKAREAVDVANARADSSDRRALLEIDQERQARGRADKQAETLRANLAQTQSRQREAELAQADAVGRLQARVDALEGSNRELRATSSQGAVELVALREQLSASQAEALRHKTEADTLRSVLERLSLPTPTVTTRPSRSRRGA